MVIYGWRVPTWLTVLLSFAVLAAVLAGLNIVLIYLDDTRTVEAEQRGPAFTLGSEHPVEGFGLTICPSKSDIYGRGLTLHLSATSDGTSHLRVSLLHTGHSTPVESMDIEVDSATTIALTRDLFMSRDDAAGCERGYTARFEHLSGSPIHIDWSLFATVRTDHDGARVAIQIDDTSGGDAR